MATLTARQRQILDFVRRRVRERGYPPSVREIGEAVGLQSSSTVHAHLNRLEEKGLIRRDPTKPRAIELVDEADVAARTASVALPLVGRVTAGAPILAVENREDMIAVPTEIVPGSRGEDHFLLRVQGDSMVEAGILDGDLVIVRRQTSALNGDIVVALVGDEATVKAFYRESGSIRLQPRNSRLAPLIVDDCQVLGKVVGLLRKM